ncbi:protein FAR-RED-ELONGATED HYPOCOTYL 1-LIKE-like [Andrographis paniculata]|uniref:protein FAR-RED-ELONGATED HYPOCOTYL 1-LIKE-like n=1 Tax=Andrographis paniculata TaxID=175694 RepID=UPI0021E81138|nr:protein FAR-RED-ELONGATED HYPOCOTYL 1-LIKE-like [Andrographis paniculata]
MAAEIKRWNKKRKQPAQDEVGEMPFPKHHNNNNKKKKKHVWRELQLQLQSPGADCDSCSSSSSSDSNAADVNTNFNLCTTAASTQHSSCSWSSQEEMNTSDDHPSTYSDHLSLSGSIQSTDIDTQLPSSIDQSDNLAYCICSCSCSCSCSSSHYKTNADTTDLENLPFYSKVVVHPNNYILSSGRWSVNQDDRAQLGGEKLTIDKEFEQYFSMLML